MHFGQSVCTFRRKNICIAVRWGTRERFKRHGGRFGSTQTDRGHDRPDGMEFTVL